MTKNIFVLVFILAAKIAFTQNNDFKLSDYKLPDLDRKSLEFNFNLAGNNIYQQYTGSEKDKSNQYTGDLQLVYNRYINSDSLQLNSNLLFNSSFER